MAPVGWEDGGDGTFIRSDNLLHLSVLLQQAVAGIPPAFLVDNLGDVLGAAPAELPPISAGGKSWGHWEARIPGSVLDIFAVEDGGSTLLVLFQHAPADRDAALAALVTPILSDFGPA